MKESEDKKPGRKEIPSGTLLKGRWRIFSLLNESQGSQLYKAMDGVLENTVWLSILHEECLQDASYFAAFERQASLFSAFKHANLARLLAYEICDSGRPFMVFEDLEGTSLAEFIKANNGISYHAALPIFAQICQAVTEAHKSGVILRQLSPSCIFLAFNKPLAEFAKITDLSSGRFLNAVDTYTAPFLASDEPCYFSPEQLRGSKQNQAVDVFALSALLYEMLSAKAAFTGRQLRSSLLYGQSLLPACFSEFRADIEIPQGLEDQIRKGLSQYVSDRQQSASKLKEEILYTLGYDSIKKLDQLLEEARAYILAHI